MSAARVAGAIARASRAPAPADAERARSGALLALASYLALFALATLSWLAALASSAPAGSHPSDARLTVWILAWVSHALRTGRDPFDAPIFHPAPDQLTGSEHFLSSQIAFLPLDALTGNPVLAANALAWLSYPLAAFAMERLLVACGLARPAAWTGGLVFALGPLRVPASLHALQVLSLYLPTAALALHRLRDRPDAARTAVACAVVALAAFSSYYVAALTAVVALVWVAVELARPLPGRAGFVAHAAVAGTIAAVALIAFSRPYFARHEAPVLRPAAAADSAGTAAAPQAAPAPVPWSVVRPLVWPADERIVPVLAAAGVVAGVLPGLRAPALAAIACVVAGAGSLLWLVAAGGMSDAVAAWLGFFRHAYRTQILTGFGASLLVGILLDGFRRVLGARAGALAAVAAAAVVTFEQGPALLAPGLDRVALRADEAAAYDEIGRITRGAGGGSALELPETGAGGVDLRPRAMLGGLRHGLPLANGFSGHYAAHFLTLNNRTRRLPEAAALDDLVDLAHLRWIVLRPAADWPDAGARQRMRAALAALPGVSPAEVGGFTLLAIERAPRHGAWFEAIASGRGLASLPLEDRRHLEPWAVREPAAAD